MLWNISTYILSFRYSIFLLFGLLVRPPSAKPPGETNLTQFYFLQSFSHFPGLTKEQQWLWLQKDKLHSLPLTQGLFVNRQTILFWCLFVFFLKRFFFAQKFTFIFCLVLLLLSVAIILGEKYNQQGFLYNIMPFYHFITLIFIYFSPFIVPW